jgi:chemotaxis protein methyltransferase CheR
MEQGSPETQRFRRWIAQRLGLHFEDARLDFLAEVLDRRADIHGVALRPYLDQLEVPGMDVELQALALELTVPETYFFRHIDQIHAFADVALPQAQAARGAARRLNMLSVGCASGEEPYSLAMVMRERGADFGWTVDIRGFDLNPAMLAKAALGRYSSWALRETPATSQRRWFRSIGKEFELDESIRAAVTFQEVNLAQENADLWAPERYDVIFCRNVLMYFTPDCSQALVTRLTRSLVPGGYLFLGHAETLRGLSNDFHLRHTHDAFYYQLKHARHDERGGECEDALDGISQDKSAEQFIVGTLASVPESGRTKSCQETFQNASDPIEAAITLVQLPVVLDLLKNERFSDALELLDRLPAESAQDADVLLLRAALLTHSGQFSTAENVSRQMLERDELNSGAHYLLALCRESAGDRQGTLDHYRSAISHDSGFAMPRLHLGLMARRAGDWEGARRELGKALLLLQREDASRLLLFGGGFGREALIALCRAELSSAGAVT